MSWLDTLDDIRTRDFSKASEKDRERAARDVVNLCSYAAAVVAISPIPFSDAVLMLPIQSAMVMTVGHIYGRKVSKASAKELIIELGTIAGVGFLARQGIKALLPLFGALLTIVPAFAANWAMGRVAMEYFKNPNATKDELKQVFQRAKEEGGSLFSKDAFNKFRKRHESSIHEVAKEEAPESEPAAAPKGRKKAAAKKPAAKKSAAKKSARGAKARSR